MPSRAFQNCVLAFSLSLVWTYQTFADDLHGYNEAVNEQGQLRETYFQFQKQFGFSPLNPPPAFIQLMSGHPLNDAIRILPVPIVLSHTDYDLLQRGATQRARALVALFADLMIHNGARLFASGKMTREQLMGVLKAEELGDLALYQKAWAGHQESEISGMVGSDIVRNPKGDFVSLEDNVGPLGGLGDFDAVQNLFAGALFRQKTEASDQIFQYFEHFVKDFSPSERASEVVAFYTEAAEPKGILPADD